MKIKEGFILREVANTIVVVPTGKAVEEFQGMITLSKSAKFVWELLQEDRTMEEIVNQLAEKYKIDFQRAKNDTERFIKKLKDAKVIEE